MASLVAGTRAWLKNLYLDCCKDNPPNNERIRRKDRIERAEAGLTEDRLYEKKKQTDGKGNLTSERAREGKKCIARTRIHT